MRPRMTDAGRVGRWLALAAVLVTPVSGANADPLAPFEVTGDAIATPLARVAGDPARGRAIVLDRAAGNCLICHRVPIEGEPFPGDIGPDLEGVGTRLTAGQLRLRLVDQSLIAPDTMMPPYHRLDGLRRVGERFRGQPVLTGQQIEDVVAWLQTLR